MNERYTLHCTHQNELGQVTPELEKVGHILGLLWAVRHHLGEAEPLQIVEAAVENVSHVRCELDRVTDLVIPRQVADVTDVLQPLEKLDHRAVLGQLFRHRRERCRSHRVSLGDMPSESAAEVLEALRQLVAPIGHLEKRNGAI